MRLLNLFESGPPHGWEPVTRDAVWLLLGSTVVPGTVWGTGERTHYSGKLERWYFVLPAGEPDNGQTIACSRNSIRPRAGKGVS